MHDGVDRMLAEQILDQSLVTDIAGHNGMAIRIRELFKVIQRASVGEHIQVHEADMRVGAQEVADEVAPDKASTARDEDVTRGIDGHI